MFSVDSVLERTGFSIILFQFRYWGFNLGSSDPTVPVVNRWLAGFYLLVTIGCFILTALISFIELIANYPIVNLDNVCEWILSCSSYLTTIFNYIAILYQARAYRTLLRSISSAIDDIPQPETRKKILKRVKINSVLNLIPLISGKIAVYAILYLKGKLCLYNSNDEAVSASFWLIAINYLVFVGNTLWVFSLGSFYIFTNGMLITSCRLLLFIIDAHFNDLRKEKKESDNHWYANPSSLKPEEISSRIILHQKLSLIVREANKVFSNFLLIALSLEITISIVYVKLLKSHDNTAAVNAYLYGVHMLLLVLKAVYCANVNDKLESSLLTNNVYLPQELSQCSSEQIYYNQYLNEQRSSRAVLTYGGLFPVRKSFIFTVLGTAITYALIVNQA